MTKTGSAVYVPWWAGHVWWKDRLSRRTTFICLTFGGLLTVDSTESTNKALVISNRKMSSERFRDLFVMIAVLLCRHAPLPLCVASVDFLSNAVLCRNFLLEKCWAPLTCSVSIGQNSSPTSWICWRRTTWGTLVQQISPPLSPPPFSWPPLLSHAPTAL